MLIGPVRRRLNLLSKPTSPFFHQVASIQGSGLFRFSKKELDWPGLEIQIREKNLDNGLPLI